MNQNSLYPQIVSALSVDTGANAFAVTSAINGVPLINGLSELDINIGGGSTVPFPTYFNGAYVAFGTIDGLVLGNISAIVIPQPAIPGDFDSLVGLTQTSLCPFGVINFAGSYGYTAFACFDGAIANPIPGVLTFEGQNAGGQDPPMSFSQVTYDYLGKSWSQQSCFSLPYSRIPFTGTTYQQVPDFNTGFVFGFVDGPGNGAVPKQVVGYKPSSKVSISPPPAFNYQPHFDDIIFDDLFYYTSGPAPYSVSAYKGGWIFVFNTAGSGPTGQLQEVVITDAGMTFYNLVRFVPQDVDAVAALQATFVDPNWQVKIGPDGVLYFSTGRSTEPNYLAYSYSPISFGYPQFIYTPGSFTLPCYTPCFPIG